MKLKTETNNPRARWLIRLVASAAVSAFVIAILLKQLPTGQGEQTATLWAVLRNVVWTWIGAYLLFQIGQTVLRTIRYGILLRAAGERDVPGFFHLLLVTMTRNMFVDLVPARAGELIYIGLLNRGYNMSAQSCISSLAVSFVFDFIALGFIFLALLAAHLARSAWNPLLAVAAALFLIIPFALLYALYVAPRPILRIARSWSSRLRVSARWPEKLFAFGDRIADAMETTRRSGTFSITLALSFGVRLCKYIGLFAAFRAVTIHNFPDMSHATLLQVMTALLTSEAAASLPLPTLMSFGTYEAGGAAAWTMLGFAASSAAIATLSFHICSQIVDYSLGGLGLLLFTLVGGRRTTPDPLRSATVARPLRAYQWAMTIVVAFLCAALAAWQLYKFKKIGPIKPPKTGHEIMNAPDVGAALKPYLDGRSGFVVWSSNRAGNHDIWRLDLPSGKTRQITRESHTDYFPRISPDGKRIVFARSREPWVPQRNETPWDTWLFDFDSDKQTKIAEFANAATWIDNDTILFQRCGTQVVSRVLSSGSEKILFRAGAGNVPDGALLETPSLDPATHNLAVTFRGSLKSTAIIDAKNNFRMVDKGCQLYWTPAGQLLDVDHGGKMRNAFYRIDPQTLKRTLFFDAPGDYSHEYFPKLSADEKFLVYGASTGAHEHDTADYEIFLWKIGSPIESAVRLTYHTGNDNWPDVWLEN